MTVLSGHDAKFQKFIFTWWGRHKRDLPWRHTSDPYRIMVSEVMLQQTQVSRVIPKYREFLNQYPSLENLSKAKVSDVIRVWKGLGYNRRALYLKRAAATLTGEYGGIFPETEEKLVRIPGLGKYTARAIMVFAYKKKVALVDTNIRKIITHFFFKDKVVNDREIYRKAEKLVPEGRSWEWHQALLDYGALEMSGYRIPIVKRTKSIPFKSSNRFFRGKIIDMLRVKAYPENTLVLKLAKTYNKEIPQLLVIVNSLAKDGLVVRSGLGRLRLP